MESNETNHVGWRYCLHCDKRQPYKIEHRIGHVEVGGRIEPYNENYTVCAECGNPVHVPDIQAMNAIAAQEAFDRLMREHE